MTEISKKYIKLGERVIELINIPGTNRYITNDEYRTEFAYENDVSADPITRCGVGRFSLSPDHKLTDACRPHDFKYNSETYQEFHPRLEADRDLRRHVSMIAPKKHWVAELFYKISRWLGGSKWEDGDTR